MSAPLPFTLPPAFIHRVQETLGEQFPAFLEALRQPAPVSIRLNPLKLTSSPNLEPVDWTDTGFYLPVRPLFAADPWWHGGGYYVQEANSMFLEQAFREAIHGVEDPVVLDLSAAPGGKSTHLASLLPAGGLLVANEVIRARANVLAENVTKWGTGNVVVTNNDPVHFGSLAGFFDVMLVDAPCSGEGLFRKDPEAVREWSEASVQLCSQRQQRIIADAWDALKPGGVLIYSTCTYQKAENEDNLKWLLENESVENVPVPLNPDWGVEKVTAGKLEGYRFWPHRTRGEGLFMAAVRKTNGKLHQPRRSRNKAITPATRKEMDMVQGWLSGEADYTWIRHNERLLALPDGSMNALEQIAGNLKIVSAGTEVAEIIRKGVNPLPGLALSVHLNRETFPVQNVEPETALRYLRREDVLPEGSPNGWGLVSYRNLPLGWVKRINNRANNYWPKEWRLRMDLAEALKASEQEDRLIHRT